MQSNTTLTEGREALTTKASMEGRDGRTKSAGEGLGTRTGVARRMRRNREVRKEVSFGMKGR